VTTFCLKTGKLSPADFMTGRERVRINGYLGGALLLAVWPVQSVFSQSLPEDVLVTGSRIAGSLQSGASVTVVTREELDRRQPTSVVDVLRQVPGLHIDQKGGRGGVSSVYMRGADPNYTLVLVDGIAVNDPTDSRGGAYDFSALDPADIERIEIARGPLSAIYGGNAVAGVINVITRRSARNGLGAEAHVGEEGMHRASLRADTTAGTMSYSATAGYADDGEQLTGDRFRARHFSGTASYVPNSDTSVHMTARHVQSDRSTFPDDSGGPLFATLRGTDESDSEETMIGATAAHSINDRIGYAASASYFRRVGSQDSPGVAPGARDPFGIPASTRDVTFERLGTTVAATFAVADSITVVTGADVYRESGDVTGSLDFGGFAMPTQFALERTQWAGFSEAAFRVKPNWSVRAGLRIDDSDGQAANTSPRLNVSYDIPTLRAQLSATWSEGFKLPSMYALSDPIVGNAALQPERSDSYELSIRSLPEQQRLQWQLTYFEATYRDAIDFDPGPPPRLVNRTRIETRGVEASARAGLNERLFIAANVLHTSNDVAGSDQELRNRPEWRGSLGVEWLPAQEWTLAAALVSSGSFADSSIPTGEVRLGSYSRVDLSASRQLGARARLLFRIANVTDEDYQEYVGFPAAGATASVGMKVNL
jgi:vitamin B12 transporter